VEPQFDEFARLDAKARVKVMKKRELFDKKKEEKWETAKKKLEDNKVKKREKKLEKAKTDSETKQKGKKRKAETPIVDQVSSDGAVKIGSSGFALTQSLLLHGLPPLVIDLASETPIDQCILNVPLSGINAPVQGTTSIPWSDIERLLLKVLYSNLYIFYIECVLNLSCWSLNF